MMHAEPRSGDVVGGYALERLLGRGASGFVFAAEAPVTGEPVAVKILDVDPASLGVTRERFQKEAAILTRVLHPHVVRIRDARVDGARPFLAMDLLSGPSLAVKLRTGPLSGAGLLRSGRELLSALAAIHAAGVLHRDLTPSNLIFDGDRLVVVDFGLARLVDEATLTRNRGMALALAYCAPERAHGAVLTTAADVYQAGLALFEMATGRRPFTAERPSDLLMAHVSEPPPRATALNPALPPLIDRVLDKALRKAPADRYADAATMEDDWRFIFERS